MIGSGQIAIATIDHLPQFKEKIEMPITEILPPLFALLMGIVVFFYLDLFCRKNKINRLSTDSLFYVEADFPCAAPYCYRWIPSLLFGQIDNIEKRKKWWSVATGTCLILSAPTFYFVLLAMGLSSMQSLLGVWFFVWMHGIFRLNVFFLLLVDQFQILLVLLTTLSALHGWIIPTIALSLLSSGFGERAPVFSAIFSLSIWPAIGIIGHLIARKIITPGALPANGPEDLWWLKTSVWKVGHKQNHSIILTYSIMILPWGLCAFLAPAGAYLFGMEYLNVLISLIIALCVSYAQLLLATDRSRLYQWAFVPVIFFSVIVIPEWTYPIVYLLYPFYTTKII